MEIIDNRRIKYLEFNVKEILLNIIKLSPQKYFIGVKKIIVLDSDYSNRNLEGRWVKYKSGSFCDIEIMIDSLDKYPGNMRETQITFIFEIANILFHEIYHQIRYIKKFRNLKKKQDESNADLFALKNTVSIMEKLYSKEELDKFKKEYYKYRNWV
jgi:hypothetical protein